VRCCYILRVILTDSTPPPPRLLTATTANYLKRATSNWYALWTGRRWLGDDLSPGPGQLDRPSLSPCNPFPLPSVFFDVHHSIHAFAAVVWEKPKPTRATCAPSRRRKGRTRRRGRGLRGRVGRGHHHYGVPTLRARYRRRQVLDEGERYGSRHMDMKLGRRDGRGGNSGRSRL
jgi:hypothetical protein